MNAMPRSGWLLITVILVYGCGQGDGNTGETSGSSSASTSTASALAAFVGTLSLIALGETGDTIATSTIVATADPSEWTFAFPNRQPEPVQIISAAGDSVVTRAGPYESVLQPGVQVITEGVIKIQGNQLSGHWTAHRTVSGPDSVLRGTYAGVRQP
jgi:hypothetical protein